jgi:dienelactone hydrolase
MRKHRSGVQRFVRYGRKLRLAVLFFAGASFAAAQNTPRQLSAIFQPKLQTPDVVAYQLEEYLLRRAPELPTPSSPEQWNAESEKIRERVLGVIYHGWPKEWVDSPPKFRDLGEISAGKGYRIRKFQYEIVPGFYSTALLYEPERHTEKAPGVLDVLGHFAAGKSEEFEQKLCINQALRGMVALNLEWLDQGELRTKENNHWYGAHLDLEGVSGLGLFYLAMRRGLDYLAQDPDVDASRIGVTGLSGGGWQTILISSLDKRVNVAIPVAGFTSLIGRVERPPGEPGDFEQNESDFLVGQDYSTLVAMRAPRPTLIITNAEDDCCFRGPLVKPEVYDPVKPIYALFGKESLLQFHADTEILAHNYGSDDRQQAYRFFDENFGLKASDREIPVGQYLKTYVELAVGLPKDNQTILGLARKMAEEIIRPPIPSGAERSAWAESERARLRDVVRYHPEAVARAWRVNDTMNNRLATLSYRFQMDNGLSATGVWLKSMDAPDGAPLTLVLNDQGRADETQKRWDQTPAVAHLVDRDREVLVVDLLLTGDASPGGRDAVVRFAEMLEAAGDRPVGLEAAQLIAIAQWTAKQKNPPSMSIEAKGLRSQVVALVAGALEPKLFSEILTRDGVRSLAYLYTKPVEFEEAPEPFCLDFYKYFDIDRLAILAEPAKVSQSDFLEMKQEKEK